MAGRNGAQVNRLTAWLAVKVYRMVPKAIRGHYPGFPTSTSHLFRYGQTWADIATYIGDSKVPRPPMPHE